MSLQNVFSGITYSIQGDGKALIYFQIDPTSGRITVARSLREDEDLVYPVST
jgi:hypothetical protein